MHQKYTLSDYKYIRKLYSLIINCRSLEDFKAFISPSVLKESKEYIKEVLSFEKSFEGKNDRKNVKIIDKGYKSLFYKFISLNPLRKIYIINRKFWDRDSFGILKEKIGFYNIMVDPTFYIRSKKNVLKIFNMPGKREIEILRIVFRGSFPLLKHIRTEKLYRNKTHFIGTWDLEACIERLNNSREKHAVPVLLNYTFGNLNSSLKRCVNGNFWFKNIIKFPALKNRGEKIEEHYIVDFQKFVNIIHNFCRKNNRKSIDMWAHNGRGFDSLIILKGLTITQNYDQIYKNFNVIINKNKVYNFSFTYMGVHIRFNCSLLLFRRSLDKLRKTFLNKGKDPYNHNLLRYKTLEILDLNIYEVLKTLSSDRNIYFHKNKFNEFIKEINRRENKKLYRKISIKEYLENYCSNDSLYLYQILYKFINDLKEEFNLPKLLKRPLFITARRLRLNLFGNIPSFYNKDIINVPTNNWLDREILRSTYKGGRTEVFKIFLDKKSKNKCYYYDFSGIYSIAMLEKLPARGIILIQNTNWKDLEKLLIEGEYMGFVKADVEMPLQTPDFPLLPTKEVKILRKRGKDLQNFKTTRKLYFPRGTFQDYFNTQELLWSRKHGVKVNKVHLVLLIKRKAVLKRYSSHNLEKKNKYKLSGNKILESLYKLLNNVIYGKLATKNTKISGLIPARNITKKYDIETILNRNCIIVEKYIKDRKITHNTNCGVSSAVRAYARIYLNNAILNIYKYNPGIKLIYCDTDSIFFEYHKEPSCPNLFEGLWWKNEILPWKTQKTITECLFVGPKFYTIKEEGAAEATTKIKGVNTKFIEGNTHEKLINEIVKADVNLNWVIDTQTELWYKVAGPSVAIIRKKLSPFVEPKRLFITDEKGSLTGYTRSKELVLGKLGTIHSGYGNQEILDWTKQKNVSKIGLEREFFHGLTQVTDERLSPPFNKKLLDGNFTYHYRNDKQLHNFLTCSFPWKQIDNGEYLIRIYESFYKVFRNLFELNGIGIRSIIVYIQDITGTDGELPQVILRPRAIYDHRELLHIGIENFKSDLDIKFYEWKHYEAKREGGFDSILLIRTLKEADDYKNQLIFKLYIKTTQETDLILTPEHEEVVTIKRNR